MAQDIITFDPFADLKDRTADPATLGFEAIKDCNEMTFRQLAVNEDKMRREALKWSEDPHLREDKDSNRMARRYLCMADVIKSIMLLRFPDGSKDWFKG